MKEPMLSGPGSLVVLHMPCDLTQGNLLHDLPQYEEWRKSKGRKYSVFPMERSVAMLAHLQKTSVPLLCCLPAVNPESVSNFICAHFTQSLLISLKGDCLIFPFACFHF